MASANGAHSNWSESGGEMRAEALDKYAELLEQNRVQAMAMCIREAGKTIPDALAEVREAVDFARCYAQWARIDFTAPIRLPGPTGEDNMIALASRGVFACISLWNFSLAIFSG